MPADRIRSAILGATLLVSFGYFYTGGGANQASRFDLVRAVIEERTLRIDTYQLNTGDKAFRNGHYYCDKAPGASFVALPFVAAARPLLRAAGGDPTSIRGLTWLTYVATLAAAGLPGVAGALLLAWVARRLGASRGGATFSAIAYGLGSPAFAYATLLWGHALS